MQEIFTVTVTIGDGKSLTHEKITGDYLDLSLALSQLSQEFSFLSGDSIESRILHGSGISPSVWDS